MKQSGKLQNRLIYSFEVEEKMITGIDKQKLKGLLESFYNLTGIKVAVYDTNFSEVYAYPEKDSRFCEMIHNNKISCNECTDSTQRLCAKCARENRIIIENCHAGLTEVISPLINGVTVIGYIMFGQITNQPDRKQFVESVTNRCREYGLAGNLLENTLSEVVYYSDKQISDTSKILDAIAKYIGLDRLVYPIETTIAYEITEHIRKNLDKRLTINDLCKKYYLSRTEIYRITKAYMPRGIGAFIREERISKAAMMLLETKKSNWEIAKETCFSDVDYFLRVFKKEKGMSVSDYRKKHNKY